MVSRLEIKERVQNAVYNLLHEQGEPLEGVIVEETADGVVVRLTLTSPPGPLSKHGEGERGEGKRKSRAARQVEESYGDGATVEETDESLVVTPPPNPLPKHGEGETEDASPGE